jgi:fibro-slime domain-containing protein
MRIVLGAAFAIAVACAVGLAASACGGSNDGSQFHNIIGSSSGGSSGGFSDYDGGALVGADGGPVTVGVGPEGGVLLAIIRDFRFYDAGDPTTDPDFENPPYNIDQNGNPSQGYMGSWDDKNIVATALGSDKKPVYANASGTTLTTHGKAMFDMWYNDTPGTNITVAYPLPIIANSNGSLQYDSQMQGAAYSPTDPSQGKGFFPIDDGTPYQTPFGDQGRLHNYSFTMELHTTFTYRGGEYFNFRGDDDVFVFINGSLVINLGGVHSAEPAQVSIDSLGLTKGQTYPLDFFSAERHVTQSNILFQTTLQLRPAGPLQ